ncbi:MAG: hypothetical protein IVW36_11745 [Dehalococcoidia bacterium]|nr:hypothetical protein [Dehalococcoidia bacterium]
MMTARTVLPTDLVALVSYDGRVYANEAITADRTGSDASPHPLETAFEQWFSFATGRHTWISVKGATLRGLLSARNRGSKLAWEVDCLIDAAADDSAVLMSLLDQMTAAAGKSRALRIFLRLPRGAYSEEIAMRCGFVPYRTEVLYHRAVSPDQKRPAPEGLRRRSNADLYALFQLYNACVPERERRIEAMTLNEWKALQEHLGRRTSQYVVERDGRVGGWLRIAADGDGGRFDALADHDALDAVVDAALAKLANRATMSTLVPEEQLGLRSRLETRDFERGDSFTVLCRRTVHPVALKAKALDRAPQIHGALTLRG